jgi:hypothetical protein
MKTTTPSETLTQFLAEQITFAPDAQENLSTVLKHYMAWCAQRFLTPDAQSGKGLLRLLEGVEGVWVTTAADVRTVHGMKLKAEPGELLPVSAPKLFSGWGRDTYPCVDFIRDHCQSAPGGKVWLVDVLERYHQECEARGCNPDVRSSRKLSEVLKKLGALVVASGGNYRRVIGVEFKP